MKRVPGLTPVAAAAWLVCVCCRSPAQDQRENLVHNGGFEDGTEGWSWGQWKGLPEPGYVDRQAA